MKHLLVTILSVGISVLSSWVGAQAASEASATVNLDATINLGATIQGNQEQPKVLYIVPWASASGPGDLDPLARQGNNVFERVFAPVERIELQRQIHYLKQANGVDLDK